MWLQVELEDLVLVEPVLDLVGHAHLEQLAGQGPLAGGDAVREDVARELHGHGAEALLDPAAPDVGQRRPDHAPPVDPPWV